MTEQSTVSVTLPCYSSVQ